jgi:hypothetical protein
MNGAQWRVPQVPPGSSQVVACVKRSEKMDRFSIVGTLNSGGPETAPDDVERRPKANGDQPIEDVIWSFRESDPPIVFRDGNAGHKAKEWAGGQRKQSTHRGPCRSRQMVSRSLLVTGTDSGTLCRNRFQVRVFLRSPVR